MSTEKQRTTRPHGSPSAGIIRFRFDGRRTRAYTQRPLSLVGPSSRFADFTLALDDNPRQGVRAWEGAVRPRLREALARRRRTSIAGIGLAVRLPLGGGAVPGVKPRPPRSALA